MTDFFAELGEHLDRSARRRARVNRARPAVTAMALVAVVGVVATSVASIDLSRDHEIAIPAPAPIGGCKSDRPPPGIAEKFGVFRLDQVDWDRPPKHVVDRVSGDLPGGAMAEIWPEHGRLAREGIGRSYWVMPAIAGTCEKPEPAVCIVYEEGELLIPACIEIEDVGRGTEVMTGRLSKGRWFIAALVPDSTKSEDLQLSGAEYFPSLEGNIWEARYEATDEEHEKVRLRFRPEEPEPPARLGPDREIPATQADGSPWPDEPAALATAIEGKVLLATAVSEQVVTASGCERDWEDSSFVGANVDEYSMTATFRGVGEIAGEPGTPAVWGCAATWNAQRRQWRDTNCKHYAPARDAEHVARSGGGMIFCPHVTAAKVLMIWIAPPADTRWVVVRRGKSYFVAYPVVAGEPVRVTYPVEDATPKDNFQRLRYQAVTEAGTVTTHEVDGAVAG